MIIRLHSYEKRLVDKMEHRSKINTPSASVAAHTSKSKQKSQPKTKDSFLGLQVDIPRTTANHSPQSHYKRKQTSISPDSLKKIKIKHKPAENEAKTAKASSKLNERNKQLRKLDSSQLSNSVSPTRRLSSFFQSKPPSQLKTSHAVYSRPTGNSTKPKIPTAGASTLHHRSLQ